MIKTNSEYLETIELIVTQALAKCCYEVQWPIVNKGLLEERYRACKAFEESEGFDWVYCKRYVEGRL